jgi:cell division protein ZapE
LHATNDLPGAYQRALREHGYEADAAQSHAVSRLHRLQLALQQTPAPAATLLGRLRRLADPGRVSAASGIYLWGGVGRGKTFVMDLFHTQLTVPSKRAHFHRFMNDVHARLRDLRAAADPLPRIAADMAGQMRVLCLDELFVSDIADAMILAGLFEGLVVNGVSLVFTSNAPPSELYRDGLQRSRFLPAIALIERHCEIIHLDAGADYRLRELEKAPLYIVPAGERADAELLERFAAIAGDAGEPGRNLQIEGRPIEVRRRTSDVAWFDFNAICDGPRGQADYVEIARDFHAVFVSDVPVFDNTLENQARRFIALVDEFYDRNVKLVVSAAAPPQALYRGDRLTFEFDRTSSRLAEMQTHNYLARAHRP